jgi:Holliday junction resolvasome RuvABC endonuclease subunit
MSRRKHREIVMGLDLSLTGTGIVIWNGRKVLYEQLVKTTNRACDEERIDMISRNIVKTWKQWKPWVVGIEGPSFASPMGAVRLGELSGVVKRRLWKLEAAWEMIPPTSAKKHFTGNGRAGKNEVVAMANKFLMTNDDNVCDGLAVAVRTFCRLVNHKSCMEMGIAQCLPSTP